MTHAETAGAVEAGERVAMYAKPAVVRIMSGCDGKYLWPRTRKTYDVRYGGMGSGFFINSSGYIATNAHVVEDAKNANKCSDGLFSTFVKMVAKDSNVNLSGMSEEQRKKYVQDVRQGGKRTEFTMVKTVRLPNGSSYPYEIKSFGAPVGEGNGKDVAIIQIRLNNTPSIRLGDSDTVRLQEHVTVAGYPGAADTFQTRVLNEQSTLEASFTDGRVSARKQMANGSPVLQISAPSTHGNSGGPVMNDAGEVIGILTFRGDTVNGQEVQGFTFIVAARSVVEFVKKAGTVSEDGTVNQLYREGLDLFWQGHYTPAIAKFDEVKRLFPQHSEVDQLIRESREAIGQGKEQPTTQPQSEGDNRGALTSRIGLIGALSVVAAASLAAAFRRKKTVTNRRRAPEGVPCRGCGEHLLVNESFCFACGTGVAVLEHPSGPEPMPAYFATETTTAGPAVSGTALSGGRS